MKTSIAPLCALPLLALALTDPSPAHAATCTISTTEVLINGGKEAGGGVPNYNQNSFEPGTNDCGPTAVGMVLGYWDANGWGCLMPDTGPYTGGGTPHASIDDTVEHFKTNLNYSSTSGTWHGPFNDWGPTIRTWVAARDAGASGWQAPDDYWVSEGDVTDEIDADRPLVLSVYGTPGKRLTWDSPTGSGSGHKTLDHAMAALGYRRVVEGDDFWGSCEDWLDYDEFYVALRSGWQNGGDRMVYYHWDFWNRKTAVKVQPQGSPVGCTPTCAWPDDGECDEPEGTGLCAEGTDTNDCTCAWPNDNECDEPEGTGLCAEGTDASDCYCPWAGDGVCDEPSGLNFCPWGSDGNDCP